MKKIFGLIILLFSITSNAQVYDWEKYADSLRTNVLDDGDIEKEFMLPEMHINFSKEDIERMKIQSILRRRILRVYPYALMTSDNLTILNENMAKMETNSEKRKYLKKTEKYLKEQFEDRLKKLSRKDGQILVKLINRQTNKTTFALVKDIKSGWSAFWSQQTAKLFDINLKTVYAPNDVLEDFYIEILLKELGDEGKIDYREAARNLNMPQVKANWKKKLGESGYYPVTE
ncbi:DUF4294 domain-containing protein [Flavobacterium sp. xlx-214]|uniref:DUF4294 domain-containing protein n=1 Tax=unclassified Flavobacterium TaxID=196869 RepID=UPI0013D6A206|nr:MULTISPECIES: DUF4294 domain-containing protein [unclassified Flavobacterium]MBA5791399.1 DUF4294 domain-containing protein [Flavobacterium sp. xlx-221]QMI83449.1 DUF4294 domain-containing protein [Flavobacterium sp. xlx-214]